MTKIPMNKLLESLGYKLNKDKSTSKNPVYIKDSEVIIITRYSNGDYLYFNPNNDTDKGNIWNFCKNRNIKLQEFQEFIPNNINQEKEIKISTKNNEDEIICRAVKLFEKFNRLQKNDLTFLTTQRYILHKNLYQLNIRVDKFNNVCYSNYIVKNDKLIKSGFTIKLAKPFKNNEKIKNLIKGIKGLELLKTKNHTQNIVIISESIIDSLSLLQIKNIPLENAIILGTGGQITKRIQETLKHIIKITPEVNIKLAFDNDNKGEEISKKIQDQIKLINPNINVDIYKSQLKDWNDDLIAINLLKIDTTNILKGFELEIDLRKELRISIYKDINKLKTISKSYKNKYINIINQKLKIGNINSSEIKNFKTFKNTL